MTQAMIGEIRMFAGNFPPKNWALCNGQLLAISSNTALFSILGTTYGGNGTTTFGLPDLRGRAPLSQGQGPGLTLRDLGEQGGEEGVALTVQQIPAHTHSATLPCNSDFNQTTKGTPINNAFGGTDPNNQGTPYYASSSNALMGASMSDPAGAGQPHANIQPSLALSFIICTNGVFPARN